MTGLSAAPGEMYDWSDYSPTHEAAGGDALNLLVRGSMPSGGTVLVVGPHSDSLLSEIATRASHLTVLVRSASDAERLSGLFADAQLVAGGLQGWIETNGRRTFDVIVALDGLDRVQSTDEPALPWTDRLELLRRSLAKDGTLLLAAHGALRSGTILDSRPTAKRHGNDEFVPLFSDDSRPASLTAFRESLGQASETALWYGFGPVGDTQLLVAAGTRVDRTLLDRAYAATAASHSSWLADPGELLDSALKAGLLSTVADLWVAALSAGQVDGEVLLTLPGVGEVIATTEDERWQVRTSHASWSFPQGRTVENIIFDYIEAEDLPAVRALSRQVWDWMRALPCNSPTVFSQIVPDGDSFAFAWKASVTHSVQPEVVFLAAWSCTLDRMLREHRRHPWPPWVIGGGLLQTLAAEVGIEPTRKLLREVTRVAKELARTAYPAAEIVSTRRELADYEELHHRIFELEGHIQGLERVLSFRDAQLRATLSDNGAGLTEEETVRLFRELSRDRRKQIPKKLVRRSLLLSKKGFSRLKELPSCFAAWSQHGRGGRES